MGRIGSHSRGQLSADDPGCRTGSRSLYLFSPVEALGFSPASSRFADLRASGLGHTNRESGPRFLRRALQPSFSAWSLPCAKLRGDFRCPVPFSCKCDVRTCASRLDAVSPKREDEGGVSSLPAPSVRPEKVL